jgi:hypothetical protein
LACLRKGEGKNPMELKKKRLLALEGKHKNMRRTAGTRALKGDTPQLKTGARTQAPGEKIVCRQC